MSTTNTIDMNGPARHGSPRGNRPQPAVTPHHTLSAGPDRRHRRLDGTEAGRVFADPVTYLRRLGLETVLEIRDETALAPAA